jgi:hypothetical protein
VELNPRAPSSPPSRSPPRRRQDASHPDRYFRSSRDLMGIELVPPAALLTSTGEPSERRELPPAPQPLRTPTSARTKTIDAERRGDLATLSP